MKIVVRTPIMKGEGKRATCPSPQKIIMFGENGFFQPFIRRIFVLFTKLYNLLYLINVYNKKLIIVEMC